MKELIIKGGSVVLPDSIADDTDVLVRDGKVAGVGMGLLSEGVDKIDARGFFVAPGLIDIHIHGGAGTSCESPTQKGMSDMSLTLARLGTTAFLPTIGALPFDSTLSALSEIADSKGDVTGAEIPGIHMEGPYLNPKRAGAQRLDAIREYSPGELNSYIEASSGCLKIMSLAPEMPGGMKLIEELSKNGVIPGAVHTDADYDTAIKAIGHGLMLTCHTFNAMRPIHHRAPGIVAAALLSNDIFCEFIADGFHVSPPIIEMAYRMKGPDKMLLVSDACGVLGLPDGDYEFSGLPMRLEGGRVTLKDSDVLSGSALPLMDGVKNLHENSLLFIPHIFKASSLNPARLLGLDDRLGSITVGKDASLVLLDERLNVIRVWVRGVEIDLLTGE